MPMARDIPHPLAGLAHDLLVSGFLVQSHAARRATKDFEPQILGIWKRPTEQLVDLVAERGLQRSPRLRTLGSYIRRGRIRVPISTNAVHGYIVIDEGVRARAGVLHPRVRRCG